MNGFVIGYDLSVNQQIKGNSCITLIGRVAYRKGGQDENNKRTAYDETREEDL
jgi:hypothetical protein